MKIAILSQPLHNNYGGILQNYALQEVLRRYGHTPTTLDIQYEIPYYPWYIRSAKFVWRMFKKIFGDKSVLFFDVKKQWIFLNTPGVHQKRFIECHIQSCIISRPLDFSFCSKNEFDAYIVGSDQVWRPRFSPAFMNYFLDFTSNCNVKRLSYAASFGTNQWEGSDTQLSDAIKLINKFDAVSVREKDAVGLCRELFDIQAEWVLDPTLLLTAEDYLSMLSESPVSNSGYLAIYVLDMNPNVKRLIEKICRHLHLVPKFIGMISRSGFASVESWISDIVSSQYVLTDSFHGTMFSILFHKEFTTVVNSGRGASRFTFISSFLGLDSHLISNCNAEIDFTPIDYVQVDSIVDTMRKKSIEFLTSTLNG